MKATGTQTELQIVTFRGDLSFPHSDTALRIFSGGCNLGSLSNFSRLRMHFNPVRRYIIPFVALLLLVPTRLAEGEEVTLNPRDFNSFNLWKEESPGKIVFDQSSITDGRLSDSALVQLAKAGDVIAKREIGIRFTSQEAAPTDQQAGLAWLEEAALAEDVLAQEHLAGCYLKGIGGMIDHVAALRWLEKAAEAGSAEAAFQAALLRFKGSPDVRNLDEGIRWLFLGAERNHAPSIRTLGWRYWDGHGVPRNKIKGYFLLRKASSLQPEAPIVRFILALPIVVAVACGFALLAFVVRVGSKRKNPGLISQGS